MSSGLMVFYPKTHQIPWGYLNSFLSVPRKEARAEAGILLTTRSSSLKKKKRNLVCSTRTALCHKIGIDLDLNRMHGTLAPKRKEAVPLLCTIAHCTVRAILYTKNVQDEKTKSKDKIVKNVKIPFQLISSKKKKMGRQTCLDNIAYC